jgi:hypothetical protein
MKTGSLLSRALSGQLPNLRALIGPRLGYLIEESGNLASGACPILRQPRRSITGLKALQGVQNSAQLCIASIKCGLQLTPLLRTRRRTSVAKTRYRRSRFQHKNVKIHPKSGHMG